jgi:alkanesulfonate monooxygenase SsuD/methylene tetrahydromethanopterin reductase-like flavin-dependent oxidoreductase (luciferase family)
VAARTSRISLGALVTGVTYRNPAFLAKVVTTLDIVSSGRAILGIGAAWNDAESDAYGYDFPRTAERFDRLEDALKICRSMLRQPQSTIHGKVARVDGAWNVPQPIQPGGPKILIGGGGERKTLRLTARYADLWNGFGDPATVHHKLEVLREHCEAVGRDPKEIVTTRLGTLIVAETMADAERRKRDWQEERGIPDESIGARLWWGDADAIRGQAKAMLDVGLGGLLFNMPAGSSPEDVRLAGEALAPLR